MRLRWPDDCEYFLNGEVDKAAHPILRRLGADGIKPDFLIHQPGRMAGNHAVIEVKSSEARANDIKKDLQNLSTFINRVGYQRAIYLVFGNGADEAKVAQLRMIGETIPNIAPIELWMHQAATHSAIYSGDLWVDLV